MSDIEQRARDALNEAGVLPQTASPAVLQAIRRALEAHDATKAEFEAFKRDVSEALAEAREETLWNAYHTGHVKDGLWSHLFMSDGEWLAQECGFDPTEYEYPDDEIRAAIPKVARAALERTETKYD